MSFSPLALWLLDPPHRRMRYVIMRADMASSAERAEPQSPSSEPAQSPDVQALSSDVQAVSSDVQALSSDVQAVSSDLQALPSNEQAVSPDEQALTPDQQALTPDQQALTPDEHAVSLDEHAVSLLEHAVSPEPTEAESEFLEVATEWILHNIIEAADIMAKTAKLKKNSQSKSLHSRAAKRASSPSINLDKSLKNIVAPATNKTSNASVLAVHHGAGITKRRAGKPLRRQQRLRHEKGMERAEAVMDKVAKKVENGKAKEKVVKERSAAWDDHNRKLPRKKQDLLGAKVEVVDDEMETDDEKAEVEEVEVKLGQEGPRGEDEWEDMDEVL